MRGNVLFDDQPVITGYRQESWVRGQAHNDLSPSEFVATFRVLRQANMRLVRDLSADHLARIGLADLALDTRIVNGHTTTSDCLWVDLPVITLKGTHFPSRVSASLLKAVEAAAKWIGGF